MTNYTKQFLWTYAMGFGLGFGLASILYTVVLR